MEDLISRQALLDLAYDMSEIDGEHFTEPWMVVDVEDIQKLPSVKPQEPKTGRWITTRTFMHDGEYYCDKCKCDSPNNEKWDYCPNCGAKMIEPQESDTEQGLSYADQDTLMSAT